MANTYSKGKNSKKKVKAKSNKIVLIILSAIVVFSIGVSLLFGLKLYAYGKDVSIVYVTNGGSIGQEMQIVEVGKSYSLPTPVRKGYQFLYWSTEENGSRKVSQNGIWIASTKPQVVLYAIWDSSYQVPDGDDWTGNY